MPVRSMSDNGGVWEEGRLRNALKRALVADAILEHVVNALQDGERSAEFQNR
jgi:hypothetical protein